MDLDLDLDLDEDFDPDQDLDQDLDLDEDLQAHFDHWKLRQQLLKVSWWVAQPEICSGTAGDMVVGHCQARAPGLTHSRSTVKFN